MDRCRYWPQPVADQPLGAGDGWSLPHRPGGQHPVRQNRLAASNAELVARLADICKAYDRRPATPAEARQILSLPPVD
jgi:hypothetical protein